MWACCPGGGSSQVRSVGGVPVELPLSEGAAKTFARVTWHASSPLRALRAAAPGVRIDYLDGRDPAAAAAAAKAADVAIVFGTQWRTEAQDLPSLALPDGQDQLIRAVAAANPRTVVVLETGGAVLMPWLDQVGAVVAAWYPGQRGGEALARLLMGDIDFSGRLPLSFPRSPAQLPRGVPADPARPIEYAEGANVGYRWFAGRGETPLFAFGHGLSYGSARFEAIGFTGGRTPQRHPDRAERRRAGDRRGATAVPDRARARARPAGRLDPRRGRGRRQPPRHDRCRSPPAGAAEGRALADRARDIPADPGYRRHPGNRQPECSRLRPPAVDAVVRRTKPSTWLRFLAYWPGPRYARHSRSAQ